MNLNNMTITLLDAGVIVITLIFFIRGVWTGFVKQVAFLAALVLGIIVAGRYHANFVKYISEYITNPQLAYIVTYSIVFLVTYILVILFGLGLKKVMEISFLGWFDRTMGGVFGLLKAIIINTLLFMFLAGILSNSNALIQKSFFSKYLILSSEFITSFVKDKHLQQRITPQKPAISAFMADPVPIMKPFWRDAGKKAENQ